MRRVRNRAVRFDGECLLIAVEPARRQVGIAGRDSVLHFVDPNVMRRQLVRIHLHPNRVLLRSENLHARNAAHHGDALRQQRLGILIHGVRRERAGGQRQ